MGQNPSTTDYRHSGSNPIYVTQEVEVYTEQVDHLMDDLFSDVEGTLKVSPPRPAVRRNHNANSTHHNGNSQSLALVSAGLDATVMDDHDRSVTLKKLNTSELSLPPISRQDLLWIEPYVGGGGADQPPETPINSPVEAEPTGVGRSSNLLERLLWIGACTSALLAAVMWSMNYGLFQRKEVRIVAAAPTGLSQEQKVFAEEIRKLLSNATNPETNRVTQATSAIPNGLPNPNGVGGNNLSVMPISPFPMGAGASGVVQYVPVYQPPITPIALPPIENTPNSLAPASPTASRPNPTPNNRSNTPNNPPSAPSALAPTAPAPNPVAAMPQPPAPNNNTFVLVGVLDLGDRSTAMFDMNGSVQSVGLGKNIANSGWKLVKVNQQEIVLRRGKESKIVFVGQRF
ncbi:MAG: hypothetical protein WCO45_18330 [Pseudanabaena sp. ELA607]